MTVHANTQSQPNSSPYDRRPGYITNHVTITVGDEYITFQNDNVTPALSYCGPHMLAALREQVPTSGTSDYDIYFGMNCLVNVQSDGTVSGAGLCSIRITALYSVHIASWRLKGESPVGYRELNYRYTSNIAKKCMGTVNAHILLY